MPISLLFPFTLERVKRTHAFPFTADRHNSYDIYHIYPYVDLPKKLGDNVKRFLVLINGVFVDNGRGFEVDERNVANFNRSFRLGFNSPTLGSYV